MLYRRSKVERAWGEISREEEGGSKPQEEAERPEERAKASASLLGEGGRGDLVISFVSL